MPMDPIDQAARHAERNLSFVRAAFCALVALRFVLIWISRTDTNDLARALQMLPPTLGAMAFSLWMIRRTKQPKPLGYLLYVSVATDALVCTTVLASNVIWPFDSYRGVLLLPETGAFLAMVMAAGYRVYPGLGWLGAGVNCTCLALLVWVDSQLNLTRIVGATDLSALYAILMGTASVIAIATSRRTLTLVETAWTQAKQIGQAEREFGVLLEDHHDASSLLSAVRLDLDLLQGDPSVAPKVASLVHDLRAVDQTIRSLRERASVQALALSPPAPVAIRASTLAIQVQLERAVVPMQLNWQIMELERWILLPGGRQAFHRILLNLVKNAQQGNGLKGARSAWVRLNSHGPRTELTIRDDGPGFATSGESTKPDGTGTGLPLVRSLVEASGGDLSLQSLEDGALINVTWPCSLEAPGVGGPAPA